MTPKRHILIIALICCLGIGMAWAVQRPEAVGRAGAFSAMTFNVGDAHQRRFPAAETAACILDKGRPEILFLQEMPRGMAGRELAKLLDYPCAVRAAAEAGKMAGLMVLSVHPILETREIELPSGGKGAGALCAVLDLNGEKVLACSVHLDEVDPKPRNAAGEVVFSARQALDFLYAEFFTDTVRTEAAKALTATLGGAGVPVILAGDFNTVPGSRTIRYMSKNYKDASWPSAAWFHGTYHKVAFPLSPRIDYIFVSDRLGVDTARVLCRSAGDHYPVKARVRLRS